jgi:hypothetical protein
VDTVEALGGMLIMQVSDEHGDPLQGVRVQFAVEPLETSGRVGSPILIYWRSDTSGTTTTDTTFADGTASTWVRFGRVAGTARLIVKVPGTNLADTLLFQTNPAAGIRFGIEQRDTILTIGKQFVLSAHLFDRFDNEVLTTPFSYSTVGSAITVTDAGVVTTQRTGRAAAVVSGGGVMGEVWVNVLPHERAIFFDPKRGVLASMNLDGTERRDIVAVGGNLLVFPRATHDERVVYHIGEPYGLSSIFIATPGGPPQILVGTATATWPVWGPDEQWVYYTISTPEPGGDDEVHARSIARIHPDGTGNEQLIAYHPRRPYDGVGAIGISPDGNNVVASEPTGLLVLDVNTRSTRLLPVTCGFPQFSPDGSRIACRDLDFVFVLKADGSDIRSFRVSGFALDKGIEWLHDGEWLLAMRGGNSPILINANDGSFFYVSSLSGQFTQAALVP